MKGKERSIAARTLSALCAIGLLASGIYILLEGFRLAAVAALICSTAGVAAPVVLSGEGILEIISGIFEAILDGFMAILEAIANFFSGLFG